MFRTPIARLLPRQVPTIRTSPFHNAYHDMTPPIAILGAGPAGLMLGRLLSLADIDYTIFDRDESAAKAWGRGGSGTLDIHTDSGQLALKEAGLFDHFKTLARFGASNVIADHRGKVFARLESEGDEDRPEIDRKDLRVILLQSVPEQKVQWGSKVKEVLKVSDGSMAVHMADGRVEAGFRLVVGADGAWSKARRLLTTAQPKYHGMHSLTTNISPKSPIYSQVEELAGTGNYMAFGEGKMVSAFRLGDASYFIACGLKLAEDWNEEHAELLQDPAALKKLLLEKHLADWAQLHKDIVHHSDGQFYIWSLYGVLAESIPWQSVPGVTLVGDAAHLTPPSGEGVNIAMFDSLQLAQQIIKYGIDGLGTAVQGYEQQMFPRALETIKEAAEMNESMYGPDSPAGWLKSMGVPVDN